MWIWLIVAIILFAFSVYVIGTHDRDDDDEISMLIIAAVISTLWPFVLTAVVASGPFYGIYKLGNYAGKKKHAKKP